VDCKSNILTINMPLKYHFKTQYILSIYCKTLLLFLNITIRIKLTGWTLDRCITNAGHSITFNKFCTLWPQSLTYYYRYFMGSKDSRWTIPVASLVDVVSTVLVLSRGHTDIITHTDADECLTHVTVVGVSKNGCFILAHLKIPCIQYNNDN